MAKSKKITGYNGGGSSVSLPTSIDSGLVRAIGANTFTDKEVDTLTVNAYSDSITGAPWGATKATIVYKDKTVQPTFNISYTLTNVQGGTTNPTTITKGQGATLTFSANSGYKLPANITVTGATLTSYSVSTGEVVISNAVDNVSVTVVGEAAMPNYLCFTANTAGSTITATGGDYATIYYSTDSGSSWNLFGENQSSHKQFVINQPLRTYDYYAIDLLPAVGTSVDFYFNNTKYTVTVATTTGYERGFEYSSGNISFSGGFANWPYNMLEFMTISGLSGATFNSIEFDYTGMSYNTITLVNTGDKVYLKGTYNSAPTSTTKMKFVMTGSIAASGNIMSLCSGDDFESVTTIPFNIMFIDLFNGCTPLTTPPSLPATTLADSCYYKMFFGCTSLTSAPALPSTTLAVSCYGSMFVGCASLVSVPKLPATTLANDCYTSMFAACTSLQANDELVAGIAEQAWKIPTSGTFTNTSEQFGMFYNCAGTRASNNMAGEAGQSYTYYTQNTPL